MTRRNIYCAECAEKVSARLTNGGEIYPHRPDLAELPFWICDTCHNYVGCHHKTNNPTEPKGIISTAELRQWRVIIHQTLDPLWKEKRIARGKAYAYISNRIGYTYHTGNVKTVDEARQIYQIVKQLQGELLTLDDLLGKV